MSIRTKLILALLAIAAVPMIALGLLGFFSARISLKETRIAGLESTADLKAAVIEGFLDDLETDLRVAQGYFNIRTNLPIVSRFVGERTNPAYLAAKKTLDDQMTTFQTAGAYLDILLVDPEGLIVYSSNEAHESPHVGGPLPGPGDKAFEEGRRGINLGDVFETEVFPNQFVMLGSAPVHGLGGNFAGVLAMEVNMDPLYKLVQEREGLDETGETLIARRAVGTDDREGALFLNPLRHDPEAALSRFVAFGETEAIPIQLALQGELGSGQSIDYRGEKVVAAWRPIGSSGWGMVAKIDSSEAFKSVTDLRNLGLGLGGAILLASVVVAALISRTIVKPIRSLEEGAGVIGSGDLFHRVGTKAGDEVGRLSRAFDQMTSDLQRITASRDELDQEVRNRQRAEEALRESQVQYIDLYEGAPIAYFSVDADGCIRRANRQAVELFGYAEEELIGRPVMDLYADTTAGKQKARELFGEFLAGEQIRSAELEFRRADGRRLWGSLSVDPTMDAEGRVQDSRSMVVDVSGRKQAEEEREVLIGELGVKNAELEQFTYTVSHDLKSPLITIKGFLGLMAQDAAAGDTERVQADMARISSAAEHMSGLLDDLLELSRIGRVIGQSEELSLSELANEAVDLVAGQVAERRVQVTVADNLPDVFGDRLRIRAVLQNLLDNAVKFLGDEPDPLVEIGVRHGDGKPVYFVRDNGIGIDPRYNQKVFGLFDQLDQRANGTGVGLALVKRIVEVHGGRIWVESGGLGHGATFCFTLQSKREAQINERS